METQTQSEAMHGLSHQHASGEVYDAQNIEAARGMCPVLGRLSLEEAGLLLELEAMGKELMAAKPDIPEKIVATKLDQPEKAIAKPHAERVEPVERPTIKLVLEHYQDQYVEAAGSPDIPENILVLQEAAKSEKLPADELREKHHENNNNHEIPVAAIVKDAEAMNILPVPPEIAMEARKTELDWRHVEKSSDLAVAVPENPEATSHTFDVAPAPTNFVGKMAPIQPVQHAEEIVAEVINEQEISRSMPLVESLKFGQELHETIEKQSEPELLVPKPPETDDTDQQEEGLIIGLIDEEDVILQTAELGEGEVVVDVSAIANSEEFSNTVELDIDTATETETNAQELVVTDYRPEFQTLISVPELPLPVEEVEAAIVQFTEILELTQPEKPTDVYRILSEIIALPAVLETKSHQPAEVVEEKLEELFIELFEEADIAYTPELIKSFIKLTQAHYLEELLEMVKDDDTQEFQGLPDEIGTREFLQKLKHGLSNLKQAAMHFYEIGKSAMQLYTLHSGNVLMTV